MKIGTIGTGFIVERFIAAARMNENCEIVACYSRTEEKGKAFAEKNQVGKVYTDLDAMFSDKEIDCIYVASPNSLHYPQSKKALLAGKNVICEKPFTSTSKELQELIEIAKKGNRFLFEAIIRLHLPNYKWLQKHWNKVGNLKFVQCNYSQYSSRYDAFLAGKKPNVFNPEFSGGAIMDINVYNIHFAVGLFGAPQKVHYFANLQDGIDTSGIVILDYGKFFVSLLGCKDSRSKNFSQIQGDQGYILIDQGAGRCGQVTTYLDKEETVIGLQEISNGMFYEIQDFLKIVNQQDYQACWDLLEESRSVIEIIEAARKDAGVIFPADQN